MHSNCIRNKAARCPFQKDPFLKFFTFSPPKKSNNFFPNKKKNSSSSRVRKWDKKIKKIKLSIKNAVTQLLISYNCLLIDVLVRENFPTVTNRNKLSRV